jgi:hypothetical protein
MRLYNISNIPFRKNVSCESRAGCCCGWNNASKFQKLEKKEQSDAVFRKRGTVKTVNLYIALKKYCVVSWKFIERSQVSKRLHLESCISCIMHIITINTVYYMYMVVFCWRRTHLLSTKLLVGISVNLHRQNNTMIIYFLKTPKTI